MRDGTIAPSADRMLSDPYDDRGNVYLFGLYLDGVLASSLRLHVGSAGQPDFPSREVFPDFLQPLLDAGKVIVDPTRFVVDDVLARLHRALPYATLRLCGMAAQYFGADHLLAAVREEHQAFYRRVFRHQLVCEPRAYPHLSKPICLMTIHYPTRRRRRLSAVSLLPHHGVRTDDVVRPQHAGRGALAGEHGRQGGSQRRPQSR
jgi:N-acyl-L-homoserine lactone synthetase